MENNELNTSEDDWIEQFIDPSVDLFPIDGILLSESMSNPIIRQEQNISENRLQWVGDESIKHYQCSQSVKKFTQKMSFESTCAKKKI